MSKKSAIKNAYSNASPEKTMGEIQALLSQNGAHEVSMAYDNGKPIAIRFAMMIENRPMTFELKVNVKGLLRAMKDDRATPNSQANLAQAERTAWKNKLEWLQIQLVEIATNQASAPELLLGYAITNNGQSVYQRLKSNQLLLENGE